MKNLFVKTKVSQPVVGEGDLSYNIPIGTLQNQSPGFSDRGFCGVFNKEVL